MNIEPKIDTHIFKGEKAISQVVELADSNTVEFYLEGQEDLPITFIRASTPEGRHVLVAGDEQLAIEIQTDPLSFTYAPFQEVQILGRSISIKACFYGENLFILCQNTTHTTPTSGERVAA